MFVHVLPISQLKLISSLNLGSIYKQKVKVREEIEEDDQYDYEKSSLQSLKAFEWLSLDHYSSEESAGSVVMIPASYFPKSAAPNFQASKEEISKSKRAVMDGSKKYRRATSAPRLRPQADRDGVIQSKTQIRRELLSPLKSHDLCLNRHTRCKNLTGDAEITSRRRQGHNKQTTDSKKSILAKGRTTPAVEKTPQEKDNEDEHY